MSDVLFRRLCAILAIVFAIASLTIGGPYETDLVVTAIVLLAIALLV